MQTEIDPKRPSRPEMETRNMATKRRTKSSRKPKTLSVKSTSSKKAGAVRGGALTIKQKIAE